MKRVAVIGSGVMGSGIAAHIANAGIPVDLLDIVPEGAQNRNMLSEGAIARALKTNPAPFTHKKNAKLVRTGNIEDHLDRLSEADWIIEVVLEDLKIKQDLYKKIDEHRRPETIISSNTSTIPLQFLIKDMPESFQENFLITHFFNPPRYMRLLEIVEGPKTKKEVVMAVKQFADVALGKGVVDCHDTPGFIANRIGCFWMFSGVNDAIEQDITVEEADLVMGKPVGIPKTGVFGLLDLVGIDLIPHLSKSLLATLPEKDFFRDIHKEHDLIKNMIAEGYTGRKGKGGFYRLNKESGKKVKESVNLQDGSYSKSKKVEVVSAKIAKGNIRTLMLGNDRAAKYAWSVLSKVLVYSASLVPEIADDICAVDAAMKMGYNWKYGPFEMIDKMGTDWFIQRLEEEGREVPEFLAKTGGEPFYKVENGIRHYFGVDGNYHPITRSEGVLLLEDIKLKSKPLIKTASASLWDVGDGVTCFEFTTKMNSIDLVLMETLDKAIDLVAANYKAMVIYNEASHFSAGANLGLALFAANVCAWDQVEDMISKGQQIYQKLKYAPFPVIGAPAGMALGGGCEILLHCDAIQAHVESYIGLVEVGVGIIPGWGGCKEMLNRWRNNPKAPQGPMPAVAQSFENISMAKVSKSALEAKELLYLGYKDGITMNRERLLADAKTRALSMAEGYEAPEPIEISLPGSTGKAAIELALNGFQLQGLTTPHDLTVADHLGDVLTGGDTDMLETLTEQDILDLERKHFMALAKTPKTLARMEHILETGKPLRN